MTPPSPLSRALTRSSGGIAWHIAGASEDVTIATSVECRQQSTVLVVGDRVYEAIVGDKQSLNFVRVQVPNVYRARLVGDVDLHPVWMEKRRLDRRLELSLALAVQGAIANVPHAHEAILATGEEPIAVGTEANDGGISVGKSRFDLVWEITENKTTYLVRPSKLINGVLLPESMSYRRMC